MAIRLGGMFSGLDTDSVVKEMLSGQRARIKTIKDKQTLVEYKQDAWRDLNTKIYSFYNNKASKMRLQGTYVTKKAVSSSSVVSVTAKADAPKGEQTIEDVKMAKAQNITGKVIVDKNNDVVTENTTYDKLGIKEGEIVTIKNGNKEVKLIFGDDTDKMKEQAMKEGAVLVTNIKDIKNSIKSAGVNSNFDKGRLFISSEETGKDNAFEISGDEDTLNKLGLTNFVKDSNGVVNASKLDKVASFTAASDASFKLNGVEFTSVTNEITINGMVIKINGDSSQNEKVNVSVKDDSSEAFGFVEGFVKDYNELIAEMNKMYSAPSARSYKPLSEEQKKNMSEDEVKNWENKIKSSILRRDDNINRITFDMRKALAETVEVDGKKYSLASFGITTSTDYKEKGKLSIDETKLKAALEEDPDKVAKVLSKIGASLYDKLSERAKGIPNTKSANKFYADKQLDKLKDSYKKHISVLENKMFKMENKYYKQFTRLEQMLAKIQGNASALGIGGNQ